jgi:hypothetical protein
MSLPYTEVIEKIFAIRINGSNQGTAFKVKYSNKILLITAKHLFGNNIKSVLIEIGTCVNGIKGFQAIPDGLPILFHQNADIAIIDLTNSNFLTNNYFETNFNFSPTSYENVYYVGFPDFVNYPLMQNSSSDYPIPYCKKAIISGKGIENNAKILLLDTISTGGMSGAPVLIKIGDNYKAIGVSVANKIHVLNSIDPLSRELQNGIFFRELEHFTVAVLIDEITGLIPNN